MAQTFKNRMVVDVDDNTRSKIEEMRWEHRVSMADVMRELIRIGLGEVERNPRPLLAADKQKGGRPVANRA